MNYRPEGCLFRSAENQRAISSADGLREAMKKELILEAKAAVCSSSHDLIVDLPCGEGIIPRSDGAVGVKEGKTRDIALISRVNKIVCFKVTEVSTDESGRVRAVLSRAAAQEDFIRERMSRLVPGDIIDAKVTHLEQFGCFVDIGCGVPSLIPIDAISVSRISHPSDRFCNGQFIKAVVRSRDGGRICLSHKELLGTWEENTALFQPGETVPGIVRSVEEYGIFVELAPNLAGLAEIRGGIVPGDSVSVYIKAMIPEKMKVKLVIVDVCGECAPDKELRYFTDCAHITEWNYAPEASGRKLTTFFA